jgi:hypothetical protein
MDWRDGIHNKKDEVLLCFVAAYMSKCFEELGIYLRMATPVVMEVRSSTGYWNVTLVKRLQQGS